MSADLFAEFGSNPASTQSTNFSRQQTANSQSSSLISDLEASEDADFGDFADPILSQPAPKQIGPTERSPQKYDDNVLFDATFETASNAEADDWGDFESAEPSAVQPEPVHAPKRVAHPIGGQHHFKSPSISSKDLDLLDSLSIEDKKPPAPKRAAPKKSHLPRNKSRPVAPSKTPAPVDEDFFGEWGDFIDGPPSAPPAQTRKPSESTSHEQQPASTERSASKAFSKISQENIPASQVRPTNIPPPSVLLELFPKVLDQLRQGALQTRKNLQQKEKVDAAASAIHYTLKTAARVIAGRTLRWKRDAILSQSMRIGPARSGKPGGMKLSAVNKNEDIKEQQQAVDVIAIWRDWTTLFNSVVQASGKRPVPVVAENVRAMTASPEQGGLKASHACALCGLKRDERLPRVDEGVEDSFGEWWTDHWGHTDCKEFWEHNMKLLSQR